MPPGCRRSSTIPTSAIVISDAENPPMLTSPLARPIDSIGMNERARSKPTIEAGPPVAVGQTRHHQQPHRCRGVAQQHRGPRHRHRHHDADHDPRAVEREVADQPAQHQPADEHPAGHHHQQGAGRRSESPWPRTRNGKPHSIAKTVAENCGREVRPHPQPGAGVAPDGLHRPGQGPQLHPRRAGAAYGESLTSADRDHQHHADRGGQREGTGPAELCSAQDSGAAATIAPSWPTWPVIWVTSGACRTRNQTETSRITLTNTIASPAPSSARASTAAGNDSDEGEGQLAAGHQHQADSSSARDPKRSSSTPTGTASRRRQELEDGEERQLGGVDLEALGGQQAGDAERAAVEDRQQVDRQRDRPDDPRPASADVVDLPVAADHSSRRPRVGRVVQFGQYPPPRHAIAHLSDPHLLAGGAKQYDVIDPEAGLLLALERLGRLDPSRTSRVHR